MPDGVQDPAALTNDELAVQLYDMLMRDIEPDLLSYNIPKLDEYYKGESTENHDKRMKRYEAAYKAFDIVFRQFMTDVQDEVRDTKRSSLVAKENEARDQEENQLASLEAAFE